MSPVSYACSSARFRLLLPVFASFLLTACFGDSDPDATPIPLPPTATRTPEATATSEPGAEQPAATVEPERIASTVWLIDAASGETTTLVEDREFYPYLTEFADDGQSVVVGYWRDNRAEYLNFGLDGTQIGMEAPAGECLQFDDRVEVAGGSYEGINCGSLSPDGRLMIYGVFSDDQRLIWDTYVIDLETDQRTLVQEGLHHCGGCDFRYGPAWSPSGRFAYYSEYAGGGRVFLTDISQMTTRVLTRGQTAVQVTSQPVWSPVTDLLLRPGEDGGTILEDAATATSAALDNVPWPARFDASGALIYTPSWSQAGAPPEQTSILDLETLQLLAAVEGAPPEDHLFNRSSPAVVQNDRGLVVAAQASRHCEGVAVYEVVPPGSKSVCLEGGGPALSPDGSRIALSRVTGTTGHVKAPGIESVSLTEYEIVVVDVATGDERVLATDAVSEAPPVLTWNRDGTHLLVRWPFWGYF